MSKINERLEKDFSLSCKGYPGGKPSGNSRCVHFPVNKLFFKKFDRSQIRGKSK